MLCPLQPYHRDISGDTKFLCGWKSSGGLVVALSLPSLPTCCALDSACFDQAWVMETIVFPLSRQLLASFCTQPAASPAQRLVSASMCLAFPQSQAQSLSTYPLVCCLARINPPGTSSSLCPRHRSQSSCPTVTIGVPPSWLAVLPH